MSVSVAEGARPGLKVNAAGSPFDVSIARAALYGSLAGLLLLLLELGVVLFTRGAEVSSIWEVHNGASMLLPAFVVLAVLAGGAGGLLLYLLSRAERSQSHRIALGLLLAAGVALAAFGVGGGRQLAGPGLRLGFALVAASVACGVAMLLAKPLARLLHRSRGLFAVGSGVVLLLVELTNHFVLVRLYPAFHTALAGAALLLAPALLLPWLKARRAAPRSTRQGLAVALGLLLAVLLAGALLRPAAERLARFDNLRLILLEAAPIAAEVVTLSAALSPPEALAPSDGPSPGAAGSGVANGPGALGFQGRDVLLVTIDALRADHVGAYGYERKLTPALDALAAQGTLFERAYCPTPHTSYSVTSLLTGKYMRPLLLQGAGEDSDTWAGLLRTYGYRTAAFYPPAVFFIDQNRFEGFAKRALDFEYRWVEFAEGEKRLAQVREYVQKSPHDKPLFLWVHLFGPHEPYEAHPGFDFGDRDVDRYDSEIAAADATLGQLVKLMEARRPGAVTIVTADHGEEFGDHGGRYHGSSVYEEQVRVPLVVVGPGVKAQRVSEVVQTIDLLPTVLSALSVPRPPRIRGRDLGPLLSGARAAAPGMAYAETEEQALYAEGTLRLLCARRLGACKLFDLSKDPGQTRDASTDNADALERLRKLQRELSASHGHYEQSGLRAEGKGWPAAILRGVGGDGDAAEEIASLLDDADASIRRKAAELLFELRRKETALALRLALGRAEDDDVRRFAALSLTRLGEGAPLTIELLHSPDLHFKRLAALALGETGDKRGQELLIAWWRDDRARDFQRSRELLEVFGALRTKDAVVPLMQSLSDVRLRPYIAATLGKIGDEAAAGALLSALSDERMQSTRVALASALVELEAGPALATPLARFLGVPDPLPGGLLLARRAKILEHIGGPIGRDAARLSRDENLGVKLTVTIPAGGNGKGVRLLVRVKNGGSAPGTLLFARGVDGAPIKPKGSTLPKLPVIDEKQALRLSVPPSSEPVELSARLPDSFGARPALRASFLLYAERGIEVETLALVPLSDELPPPPPKPW
ncbi:MAG TPA: sulfatase-like hydrolase/transferase [Polyangiaceae bacterium]|nr:sulfatase-like hydrolase/transferase [Polyangiaceae bacterium]